MTPEMRELELIARQDQEEYEDLIQKTKQKEEELEQIKKSTEKLNKKITNIEKEEQEQQKLKIESAKKARKSLYDLNNIDKNISKI